MEAIGCLVPELRNETHREHGMRNATFRENAMFLLTTVNFNVSIYYRVM